MERALREIRSAEFGPAELIGAWGGGVDQYYADVERLMATALGELSDDTTALTVVSSVFGPPTYFAMRARGLSSDEAVRSSLEVTLPWLDQRRRGRADRA